MLTSSMYEERDQFIPRVYQNKILEKGVARMYSSALTACIPGAALVFNMGKMTFQAELRASPIIPICARCLIT